MNEIRYNNEDDEIRVVVEFAKGYLHATETYPLYHIDSTGRVKRYVKKADEVMRYVPQGRILDWGSGYGQMFYFLYNRGIDVVGCEFSEHYKNGTLADLLGLNTIYLTDPVTMPFEDSSFDGVLSCGVLEHVENHEGSIKEIYRILKKGGYFFIYNLPNRFSWMEFVSRQILQKGHERLYGLSKTIEWLKGYDFKVVTSYYECFLPVNMGCAGNGLRELADNLLYVALDKVIAHITPLKYLSQNLTLICRKEG